METIDELAYKQKQDEGLQGSGQTTYRVMSSLEGYHPIEKKEQVLNRRRTLLAALLVFGWLFSKVAYQWCLGAHRPGPFFAELNIPERPRDTGLDFFNWTSVSSIVISLFHFEHDAESETAFSFEATELDSVL